MASRAVRAAMALLAAMVAANRFLGSEYERLGSRGLAGRDRDGVVVVDDQPDGPWRWQVRGEWLCGIGGPNMPNCPNWIVQVVTVLGLVLIFILHLVVVCRLLASDRQLAEVSAQLEYQRAVTQWMRERLQQLVQEAETLGGHKEDAGVRLRLDQEGNLQEVGGGRDS